MWVKKSGRAKPVIKVPESHWRTASSEKVGLWPMGGRLLPQRGEAAQRGAWVRWPSGSSRLFRETAFVRIVGHPIIATNPLQIYYVVGS